MSGPAASYIQNPLDGGNTGQKFRTQQRKIGSDWMEEILIISPSGAAHQPTWEGEHNYTGIYYVNIPVASVVQTAHDATTTGFAWLVNPVSSTKGIHLRKIFIRHTAVGAGLTHDSAPRVAFARGTHNDGWAGATLTAAKRKTTDPDPTFTLRSAATGASSLTPGAIFWASLVPGISLVTADIVNPRFTELWYPRTESDQLEIAPGECLIVYQADNGTASDQRKIEIDLVIDEFDWS